MRKIPLYGLALFLVGCTIGGGFDLNQWNDEFNYSGEHFDATINGAHWYPEQEINWGDVPGPGPMSMSINPFPYHNGTFSFVMYVRRDYNPVSSITIEMDSVSGTGTYSLSDSGHTA